MKALPSRDGSLIRGKLSHIQHSEHPTMVSIRHIVTQWGRRIVGGLIVALLFSQMALAMYACPKLDADTHAASMQMAGMAMDEATGMSAMPDCHAMPGTMDDESPQLCRAHCSGDGKPAPSPQGLDGLSTAAAHAVWIAYLLPVVPDPQSSTDARADPAWLDHRTGSFPFHLTFQVLRN